MAHFFCRLRNTPAMVTLIYDFTEQKTMCVDLHIHSVFSDGTATLPELIQLAVDRQLTGLALTDHDTTEGVVEFLKQKKKKNLLTISGLEISAVHHGYSLHILGYGIDPENPALCHWLDQLQQGRKERNQHILEKLKTLGLEITSQEVAGLSPQGQTGRPHIARLLTAKGYVQSVNDAFRLYLGKDKPAWCRRTSYTAAESIDIIHQAGGIAVLAHPGQLDPSMKKQPQLVRELCERRLDGLEIYYPAHTRIMQKKLLGLARKYDLLATGGSDYHGPHQSAGLAGGKNNICPPDTIMEELFKRCGR